MHVIVQGDIKLDSSKKDDINLMKVITKLVIEQRKMYAEAKRKQSLNAKKAGKQIGRPVKSKPENFNKVLKKYKSNKISARKAAKECGVCDHTFKKWTEENEN